ncbi:MAG TPA: hypothetical protein VMT63_05820 [Bacteroidales bacterium]|nr:hypothetical protein [Bacteroidales bacterium]
MKRTLRLVFLVATGAVFLAIQAVAQDKKEEKKIKIIISDNGKTNVLIDTVIYGQSTDSIIMKNGQTIHLKENRDHFVTADQKDGKSFTVAYSSDGKGEKDEMKEIIISTGNDIEENVEKESITGKEGNTGEKGDKLSYVIARGGMVITIEGSDETKISELATFIEAKLGGSKEATKTGKTESKDTGSKDRKK